MSYCIAIFNDDELELAIGRAGVNVNLAANVTNYKIDAFGKKEYERKQVEQETLLSTIDNVNKDIIKLLKENDINTVSELLNASEDSLLEINGLSEDYLEQIYDNVQSFIEQNQLDEDNKSESDNIVEENKEDDDDEPDANEVIEEIEKKEAEV